MNAHDAAGEINLKGVTKVYGDQRVVDNVSLTIPSGQFFSLLGPSGSGKTSTLMMLAGFSFPDEGIISVDGRDITHSTPQARGIGMVFQNYALFPNMSVYQNVAFPLRVRKMSRSDISRRVDWALDVVKLREFGSRFPKELSGGQQQRVALARAIVFHPKLILMDEPLGALDKNLRYHMQVELKEIQKRLGMTVVYVTHDQEEAMNMSDQMAIMRGGKIEQRGTPKELYEHPRTMFAAKFLGEANLIDPQLIQGGKTVSLPAAKIFVRPERACLTRLTEGPSNLGRCLFGEVARYSYLGGITRYSVAVTDTDAVIVDVKNTADGHVFEPGSKVAVHWSNSDESTLTQ